MTPERMQSEQWHAMPATEAVAELDSDARRGLDHHEVYSRIARYGPNSIPHASRGSWLIRFLREFYNPLTAVLALAVGLTIYLGDYVDSVVISTVIVVNALIGFVQEFRAERALQEVAQLLSPHATVTREGRRESIAAEELVPGDLVWLAAGDRVSADMRIIESDSLEIDESTLTGESVPTQKSADAITGATAVADRRNMAFAGTLVTRGSGHALVVATGGRTQLGAIGSMVSTVQRLRTPLTRRLDRLAVQISTVVMGIALATLAWGYFVTERSVDFLIIAVVGLAVGAIPEGLPAVVTFALAWSARRLGRMGALVRRLPAVEALGSVDVVFTDKTGTLTTNEMTAVALETPLSSHRVTGTGYDAEGLIEGLQPQTGEAATDLIRAFSLCNDAQFRVHNAATITSGDPTEIALMVLAEKAGLSPEARAKDFPRVDVLPFDADQQYMVTEHQSPDGRLLVMKGAPERVLMVCEDSLSADESARWAHRVEEYARSGHRVLAAAVARDESLGKHSQADWQFLGIVALVDPPRPDAIASVAECQDAGVHVVMVTGDHPETARAIADQLGLGGNGVLTGTDIDEMSDEKLTAALETSTVMARVSPANKLRLVQLSQAAGHFVAMTGDGVNDAPALRQAHIGVAMGKKGTDVAREAADIVLTDDQFSTISRAIREGRRVYDNIKKSILFLLATDLDEAALIVLAILFGISLPVTPTQILWVNLVTSVTLSFALILERAEPTVMRRGPNSQSLSLISRRMLWRMLLVASLSVGATFWIFYEQLAIGVALEEAQTAAVTMLVVVEMAILINHRRFTQPALSREGLAGNTAALAVIALLVMLQLAFVYLPVMNDVFGSRPLPANSWLLILATAAGVFIVIELEKWWRRRQGQTWL